jgi:hypothetical protein
VGEGNDREGRRLQLVDLHDLSFFTYWRITSNR